MIFGKPCMKKQEVVIDKIKNSLILGLSIPYTLSLSRLLIKTATIRIEKILLLQK